MSTVADLTTYNPCSIENVDEFDEWMAMQELVAESIKRVRA